MRIALTHAYSWPEVRRGGERFLHELAAALAWRHHHVTVLTAGHGPGRWIEGGVHTVRLPQRRDDGGHQADFGRRVLPYLLAGRYDVVHSLGRRDAVASIRAAWAHPRRRTVFTDLGLPVRWFWEGQGVENRYQERVVRDVDVYGCLSKFAVRTLAEDYGRTGTLIPGGVDVERFVPTSGRAPTPTLLFSGTLDEPRKGVATLLRALALVAEAEPDVRLWLSGPGDARPLLAAAPDASRVRTDVLPLGRAESQSERYGRAWATVLASTYEAFGLALLESLACGTPVVASTHASLPELVTPGTGTLCRPDDARSLADACLGAFELARGPGTVDACRVSAEPFDWRTRLVPSLEAVYARP